MSTLTVTTKGQITLRKDLLAHLGVRPGSRLDVHKLPDGRIEVRAAPAKQSIGAFCGSLRREGQKPVSIEDMNETIAKGWAGEL